MPPRSSKPNGRLCMFLVSAALVVVILLSYKWFMVPSGVERVRKDTLYYKQQRLQQMNNKKGNSGQQQGRNFFDDSSLTDGKMKARYSDRKQSDQNIDIKNENENVLQNENNKQAPASGKNAVDYDEEKGSEETMSENKFAEPLPKPQVQVLEPKHVNLDATSIQSLYMDPDPSYVDTFNTLIRIVHLDLKGAAPNMEYLKKLFPFFKALGATGVLIEYEDMFPYSGKLSPLAAGNHYSKENIDTINKLAIDNNLDIIPLIQTFGHMEFALKSEEFLNLREDGNLPLVIHPGNNKTYDFLFDMIDQVAELHPGKRFLHIGSDEVYSLRKGKSKNMLSENTTITHLFFKHLTKVAKYVKEKYGARPIVWDDMFRHVDLETLKKKLDVVLKIFQHGSCVTVQELCPLADPQTTLLRSFSMKNGSQECELCKEGYFQHQANKTNCNPCEPGGYCDTEGCPVCNPCPAGQETIGESEKIHCTLCKKGYYKKEEAYAVCQMCEDGYYTVDEGSLVCKICPANKYCPYAYDEPIDCPESSVCPAGSTSPLTCDGPFFSPNKSSLDCQPTPEFFAIIGGCSVVLLISAALGIYKFRSYKRNKLLQEESQPLTQSGSQMYTGL